jgi:hypothetical protein
VAEKANLCWRSWFLGILARDNCRDENPSLADLSHKSVTADEKLAQVLAIHIILNLHSISAPLQSMLKISSLWQVRCSESGA